MNSSRALRTASFLLALLASARPCGATWPRDPAVNVPVTTPASGADFLPTIAPDGTGGTIVVWFDARSGSSHIYAQHINNKGVATWTTGGVPVCLAPGGQSYPTAVADGAGGALITWHDTRSGNFDIYAQRINSAGQTQWAESGIPVCTAAGSQVNLASIPDGVGGVIATWLDDRNGDGGDIYAQRLGPSGTSLWAANGVAVCTASGTQRVPRPVSDGAGGLIVTWEDARSALATIYAQRVNGAGAVQWAANGVQIMFGCIEPTIAADGAGGAIIAWTDGRGGSSAYDIYAQRVNPAGVLQWNTNGVAVCKAASRQETPRAVSDGAGGAIVAWMDWRNPDIDNLFDIYARRITAAGLPVWTPDGVALSTAFAAQQLPEIVSDGAGGAIVAWQDSRNGAGNSDVFVRRVNAAGVPQWAADGVAVSSAANNQVLPTLIADGRLGAIVAWFDYRSGVGYGLYVQRIDGFGLVGDPAPEIVSVRDLPNDQGGRLRIKWNASFRDTFPTLDVGAYGVWRQVTAAAAANVLARGGREAEPAEGDAAAPGRLRTVRTSAQVTYWEGVGSVLARGEPWYTFVADTFEDSTAAANPYTVYMVDVHDAHLPQFWSSVSDSGYSVDNLPPAAPAPFTGQYTAGVAHLDWGANTENDLAGYRLYRGSTFGFAPGPANQVASLTGTHADDVAPQGSFYKLSAVDVHGNESVHTPLAFGTADASGRTAPRELALAEPSPNPARSTITLRFVVPRAEHVSLVVFDAGGRSVRRLVDMPRAAGEYAANWDLRDEHGSAVASGQYFVQLRAEGREVTRRIVAVR